MYEKSVAKKSLARFFRASCVKFFFELCQGHLETHSDSSSLSLQRPTLILPLSLSLCKVPLLLPTLKTHRSLSFENFSKLDEKMYKNVHLEKIKIEKLLYKSNSQRQIDDRLSWVSTIRNAKIAQSFTTLGSIKVVYSSFEMIAQ